ncbi:MAG: alpha/beta fold hydrolase [Saprospiraceae bacterium]
MKYSCVFQNTTLSWYQDGEVGSPPLVLLHGFCETSSIWDDTLTRLPGLPILRIDLPGFGSSSLPTEASISHYAACVQAVLDAAEVQQCVLVGHSLGGYVALEFAQKYADRLLGYGLYHAHPFADTPERVKARHKGIELLQSGKKALYVSQLFPGLFTPEFAKAHPKIVQNLIETGQKQETEGIIAALEVMLKRPDHTATLQTASCPVFLLLGAADPLIAVQDTLKAALPADALSVSVLPGVAHMGMFESAAICSQIVAQFWQFCTRPHLSI